VVWGPQEPCSLWPLGQVGAPPSFSPLTCSPCLPCPGLCSPGTPVCSLWGPAAINSATFCVYDTDTKHFSSLQCLLAGECWKVRRASPLPHLLVSETVLQLLTHASRPTL